MNDYLIEHKIKTLSELSNKEKPEIGKFCHQGYEFRQWDFTIAEGPKGYAWSVKRIISANNAVEAINSFRNDLSDITDRIGFVSQCYTTMELEPLIVMKENNNPERNFLLHYTKETGGVPLHFDEGEQEAFKKLETYEKQPVFKYLSESTRAGTYYTRLAMLIISLEAIAGEITDENGNKYANKDYIRDEIIKDDDLFQKIFKYEEGIRNKIFHGKKVEFDDDYVRKIYRKIIDYFNDKYQTKINTNIVNPQRTPTGNYRGGWVWLMPGIENKELDLKEIIEELERYEKREENHFREKFSFIVPINNY